MKKNGDLFASTKKSRTFASLLRNKANDIGIWCNGNTTDSGPVIPGSNPGIPTH